MENKTGNIISPIFCAILIFMLSLHWLDYRFTPDIETYHESMEMGRYYYPYLRMKDTIHLLDDEYIEIRLWEQKAHLIRRNDTSIVYKISTGNPAIEKGLATPVGFYTVQTKSPMAISKQFENAELHNWIGFNGNIGFHGLKTSGYYSSLGLRPSSHGCVRIGRESGADLYKRIQRGTPVIVYIEKPAVVIAFAKIAEFDESKDFLLGNYSISNRRMFSRRINNLHKGIALRYNTGRIFLDGKTILKPGGYEIGYENQIPVRQKRPLVVGKYSVIEPDNLITYYLQPAINDSINAGGKNVIEKRTNQPKN